MQDERYLFLQAKRNGVACIDSAAAISSHEGGLAVELL